MSESLLLYSCPTNQTAMCGASCIMHHMSCFKLIALCNMQGACHVASGRDEEVKSGAQ